MKSTDLVSIALSTDKLEKQVPLTSVPSVGPTPKRAGGRRKRSASDGRRRSAGDGRPRRGDGERRKKRRERDELLKCVS